jgi:hypothetical protein
MLPGGGAYAPAFCPLRALRSSRGCLSQAVPCSSSRATKGSRTRGSKALSRYSRKNSSTRPSSQASL